MLIYLPRIDRHAAMIAGYELDAKPSVNVDLAALDETTRQELAEQVTIQSDGTGYTYLEPIAPTVDALLQCLDQRRAKLVALLTAYVAATALVENAQPEPCDNAKWHENERYHYAGFCAPYLPEPSLGTITWSEAHDTPEYRAYRQAISALNERVAVADQAAFTAALPALLAQREAQKAQDAQRETERAAKREADITERAAKRLATGYWEADTAAYNARRCGKPWCAKVTGTDAKGRLVYEWGQWTGRIGEGGELRLECKPGEVIAWGQKDLRRPDRSDHTIAIMQDNGRLESVSAAQAAAHLRSKATGEQP